MLISSAIICGGERPKPSAARGWVRASNLSPAAAKAQPGLLGQRSGMMPRPCRQYGLTKPATVSQLEGAHGPAAAMSIRYGATAMTPSV